MIDEVKIGAFVYAVSEDEARVLRESADTWAFIDEASQEIVIRPDLAHDAKASSLLHEVLHGCVYASGLSFDERSTDLEERIVHGVARTLYGVLRDNPEMVAYLVGEG